MLQAAQHQIIIVALMLEAHELEEMRAAGEFGHSGMLREGSDGAVICIYMRG